MNFNLPSALQSQHNFIVLWSQVDFSEQKSSSRTCENTHFRVRGISKQKKKPHNKLPVWWPWLSSKSANPVSMESGVWLGIFHKGSWSKTSGLPSDILLSPQNQDEPLHFCHRRPIFKYTEHVYEHIRKLLSNTSHSCALPILTSKTV